MMHYFNSDIAREAHKRVAKWIQGSREAEIHWSTIAEKEIQFFVENLQLNSAKS